ncbi:MAG: hypothetical protein E5V72_14785 [Mesorhizobium sp.]|nr:hypothetical protein EJ066_13685 [Mesorhizobium sp. M9A.F.Ca.ET.002.03.1.2]RUW86449.1 hypothetical protein EOA29_00605 [Mesorhizobium sp. M1E.F.Ca.ET.063.01.1.1]RWC40172.1 MAG: hypothetical protein EOS28_24450 [Mesorhizobium sp.]TGR05711.1 hypothetical protein EN843_21625 [Mesorhizobium sp. M4B.F.Ca.ET.200.01.1.1]TGS16344.1 hypothetical protein EN833_21635 [Mesorhizobium sp. M4B.F.Ca.ET.190.01.1.1]TGT28545.1 hypothetical protein EN815_21610 [Mesorhizobium sp. M4B.F.Ca.ET.172.01.1.1]
MSASDIYENAPLGSLINYGDRAPKPLARQDRLMNALPARAAGITAGFLDQTASDRTSRATPILHAADQITPFLERGRPIGANARERACKDRQGRMGFLGTGRGQPEPVSCACPRESLYPPCDRHRHC